MNRYGKFLLIFVLLTGLAQAKQPLKAEKFTNADCLACHNDASLTKEENGKQVSLQVKEEQFKNSIHGSMFSCTDCHKDVTSVPHESTPAKPSCAQCHGDEQKAYDIFFGSKCAETTIGKQDAAKLFARRKSLRIMRGQIRKFFSMLSISGQSAKPQCADCVFMKATPFG